MARLALFMTAWWLNPALTHAAVNLTQTNFTGVLVPQYCGDNGPGGAGTARVPCFYRATVSGLAPGTSYRYYAQAAISTDLGAAQSIAGNPILVSATGSTFTYTSSPGLSTAGTYETFTTDAAGSFTGWFSFVPTTNARFAPGTVVYPAITINGSGTSTTVTYRFALDVTITCLDLATSAGPNNSSAICGNSSGAPKNFVLLYDNTVGTGRPLACTDIEDDTVTFTGAAAFYASSVNAVSGAWGTIIPNNNASGVRRIEQRDYAGVTIGFNTDTDGNWPSGAATANPTAGAAAIVISVSDAALNGITPSLASSLNPAGYHASLTFTAGLPADATGSVVFSANGLPFSTKDVLHGSATSASLSTLPRGTNIITAVYVAGGNSLGGTNCLNQIVTNHPPAAAAANCIRNADIPSLHISISNLLANVKDADNDPITLVGTSLSTNGITLANDSVCLSYLNTNAVNDQFTYTVTDGFGGTNSALVNIIVSTNALGGQVQNFKLDGGCRKATLNFAGIPNFGYAVQRSTNLTDWADVLLTNAPGDGLFQFADDLGPNPPAALYYRLRYNP
jgi:hypothetical protein